MLNIKLKLINLKERYYLEKKIALIRTYIKTFIEYELYIFFFRKLFIKIFNWTRVINTYSMQFYNVLITI